ncbi:site-2 protease family protein [Pelagicoccus enzymogenes]|uniref:site-2 protease family protein n=1 Tax=Pelagicoccus enzymogenes TaxID=2773457 RepID=UPI00280C673D|nr:site-2 protease family protein [Pelagicoccus enzymogenes]MDQ8198435.1 site-2 protease family protein [Pelagicoccus enzymogenes]
MKWSLKIGRIFGIDLYLHFTFLLLLAFLGSVTWRTTGSLDSALSTVTFIVVVFCCVLIHELAHALMAREYGVKTRDITLLPIGGVARLESASLRPMQEFWIALAGPAASLAIAIALFAWIFIAEGASAATDFSLSAGNAYRKLLAINLAIVGFNLLPAFPMDGGRILRALLSLRIGHRRATAVAANFGQAFAILFGIVGFFYNPILIFIAVFVFLGAQAEAGIVEMEFALKGLQVRDGTQSQFRTLSPSDTLDHAAEQILAGSQQDFPVVENGETLGMLVHKDLIRALKTGQHDRRVEAFMLTDSPKVQESASLQEAVESMTRQRCSTFSVMNGEKLVGILTREHVAEMILIHSASAQQEQADTPHTKATTSPHSPAPPQP